MTANRTFVIPNSLIPGAIGVSAVALAVLVAFPGNLRVWQVASWVLIFALLALLAFMLVSAYSLATDPAARTWQRIASFSLGLACLVVIAIGSL
jgi:hypothetical protein